MSRIRTPYIQPPTKKSDYRLDLLVKEVRKLDKYSGLKLKHPVSCMEPVVSYGLNIQNARIYFLSIAIILNDQEPEVYFARDHGCLHNVEKVSVDNDFFVEHSNLFHFDNRKKYEIDSDEFRGRFVTLLCMKISDNISDIVESKFAISGKKLNEYEEKELILHDVVRIFNRFIISYLEGHDFENNLFNMFVLLTLRKAYKKNVRKTRIKMVDTLATQGDRLAEGRTSSLISPMLMDDDVAINNVIKLAYVAMTENPDVSNSPFISEGITIKDSDDIKELVTALGTTIDMFTSKKPLLYSTFMRTIPNLYYKWNDINTNLSLNIGCKALSYLDFICHDPVIHRLIESMIVK